jgi:TatD DNase family protein
MKMPGTNELIDIHVHEPGSTSFCLKNIFAQEITLPFCPSHYCSIGLHPWHINDEAPSLIERMQQVAASHKVLAIGETGLDKTINTTLPMQESVFLKELELAEAVTKPVIIHCVKAYSELMHIRKMRAPVVPWIIHWFNENIQIAGQLIDSGCYLSFGRSLFHPNGRNASVFREVPLECVFFETDDAGITIESVYAKASEIKHMEIDSLKKQIVFNFNTLFNKVD